ncbi:TPA: FHIPEP family type III secretion protein [Candidatus Galligastranaerophilus intestinavium]|uniref:FHIPEP family type III secretion protein n=1 Tax=Candidatus Galligastranaerophilus intestinavium TaxID=2840836 RepID=A0A9D1FIB9_9BACT|nr:FHIPEP family type III secretion protein [Candidatus Galligastranaerophilus intestinavium]
MAQQNAQSNPISEIFLAVFVIILILILLIEMPNWVINFSISLNITLGIVLLMISLYVQKPLELAAFPSIILIGTMFRLVLSIASTRLILAKGDAGEVVHAFGSFVTGGNMVVGGVIFLIITVVQFMVITKGAERIAEVSARFALDAMPGKQMTIDADFNAGLISPEEAVKRREDLQRESSLFGSMDGAMKFVKGDTIAGIIIVVINIVGGLIIGIVMNGMPAADAVSKYTILTIGDGLASQVPSLLMSISAGIVMTRSTATGSSLGIDLANQILAKPQSLFFACGFLLLIAITGPITGLPWLPFLMFTIIIALAGFSVLVNADVQAQLGQLDAVKQNMQDLVNPNKMYERLGVDVLSLQVGSGLLIIADPDQDGQLLAKIAALRQRVTDELGYIIPNIRIMDSSAIADNEYLIAIRSNTVATGMVYPGKYMVIADQWEALGKKLPENAIVSVDPTYQSQAYWLDPQYIDKKDKITAVDSVDVIVTHLQECVRKYVDEVMTKTDVLKLMELVKSQDPTLVNDLVPTIISTSDLRKIFVNLIREKVSIKDIIFIFERLCDYARFSKEPDILSERLRAALGRQICLAHCNKEKVLYALTLSSEWEKTLDDSCQRTELGTMFLLNPMQVQELIESTANTLMRAHQAVGTQPVILCSPRIRLPLYQMLERHIPTIVVISYSELITDIRVEAIDTIGESSYA